MATFSVIVTLGRRRGVALVDSGSSHAFVDLKFATSANCVTQNNYVQKVNLAGGGILYTGAHLAKCEYEIQGEKFRGTFKIMKLKTYDITLGCDWIYTHSLIKLNLKSRELTIKKEGQ